MTDILFYHLMAKPVQDVLPDLLRKSLSRNWNVVIHGTDEERIKALNTYLWTYQDDSFLPHSMKGEGEAMDHPIWLTDEDDNPNQAAIRFLIDGAKTAYTENYERVIYLFDGHDRQALTQARLSWKEEKAAGHTVTYWAQNAMGRWEKKA